MAIEIVDFPIKNGDFPLLCDSSPEGRVKIIVLGCYWNLQSCCNWAWKSLCKDHVIGALDHLKNHDLWFNWSHHIVLVLLYDYCNSRNGVLNSNSVKQKPWHSSSVQLVKHQPCSIGRDHTYFQTNPVVMLLVIWYTIYPSISQYILQY